MPVLIDPIEEEVALRDAGIIGRGGGMGNALYAVSYDRLPNEARVTLQLIGNGGPFLYPARDGSPFQDAFGDLPAGAYREFTVPTPGTSGRGARRIVVRHNGISFFTACHYERFRGRFSVDERRLLTRLIDERWRNGFYVINGVPPDLAGKIRRYITSIGRLALPEPRAGNTNP